MSSPQLENGYTRIANELLEALCRIRVPGESRQVLDFIIRKTYGFNKKEDRIALSQICDGTGLKKSTSCKGINKLISMNLITKKVTVWGNVYKLNKDSDTWTPLPKKEMVVTQLGNNRYPKRVPQKTITKETITKGKNEQSSSPLIKNNKMKNSFKYQESATSDTFEDVVDYDTGISKTPPKKKVSRNKQALDIQSKFLEECKTQTGVQPIKDAKGYYVVLNAMNHLKEDEIDSFVSGWFSSGEPIENLVQITRCFSNNQINKWRAKN